MKKEVNLPRKEKTCSEIKYSHVTTRNTRFSNRRPEQNYISKFTKLACGGSQSIEKPKRTMKQ